MKSLEHESVQAREASSASLAVKKELFAGGISGFAQVYTLAYYLQRGGIPGFPKTMSDGFKSPQTMWTCGTEDWAGDLGCGAVLNIEAISAASEASSSLSCA